MTQKEIAIIKKRAKECFNAVGLHIPMTKMDIILFIPSRDGYGITPYKVYMYNKETGKAELYKEGNIEND